MGSKILAFIIISCISAVLVLLSLPYLDIHIFKKGNGDRCYVSSECFQDLGLSCLTSNSDRRICQCSDSNYWDEDKQRCVGKKTNMLSCSSSIECSDSKGLSCLNNGCQCKAPDSYFDAKHEYCFPKKSIGNACDFNEHCLENKGLTCDGRTRTCGCSYSMFWDSDKFECTEKKSNGEQCSAQNECKADFACSNNVCVCSDNRIWTDGECKYVQKSENEACESTKDCIGDKGLDCINNLCLCSDRRKFFLPSAECIFGINNNISTHELFETGYSLIYNHPMKHKSTNEEILEIRSHCEEKSILCLAGANNGGNNLVVVACGNCLEVLSETLPEQPKLHGNTWWYFTPDYSVGFSGSQKIKQVKADPMEEETNSRLSWHITGNDGGWRAGDLRFLTDSTTVLKYAFIKN